MYEYIYIYICMYIHAYLYLHICVYIYYIYTQKSRGIRSPSLEEVPGIFGAQQRGGAYAALDAAYMVFLRHL